VLDRFGTEKLLSQESGQEGMNRIRDRRRERMKRKGLRTRSDIAADGGTADRKPGGPHKGSLEERSGKCPGDRVTD